MGLTIWSILFLMVYKPIYAMIEKEICEVLMEKIKVLFVHGGILAKAGTESYMMSVFDNVDPEEVQIDFVVFGVDEGYYDQGLKDKGVNIYPIKYRPKDFFKDKDSLRTLKHQIQKEQYDIVHVHMNAFNAPVIAMFRKWGIPVAVAHSHTNEYMSQNKVIIQLKKHLKKKTPNVADLLVACSIDAGEFQYKDADFTVINNGIDIDKFSYNEEVRNKIREEYDLNGHFVLGNIGRFNFQKNHDFLLDIFHEYLKLDDTGLLMLIGEGELDAKIRTKATSLGIIDKIRFLGIKPDTAPYYQAMDAFVLPSLFEGLGIVLVEAQAAGLECYASTFVPREASMGEHCQFIELKDPKEWADAVYARKDGIRVDGSQDVYNNKYDAYGSAQHLISLYRKLLENR